MKGFEIHCDDDKGYSKRVGTSLTGALAIILFIFVLGALITKGSINWPSFIGLGVFIFIIVYFQALRSERFYILSISINAHEVELSYADRGIIKSVKDDANLFRFKKTTGFGKTRIVNLSVLYNGKPLFRQTRTGYWTESRFDEIIEAFSERNSSQDKTPTMTEVLLPQKGFHIEDAEQVINMGGPWIGSLYLESKLISSGCILDNILLDEKTHRIYFVKYHNYTTRASGRYFTINYYCIDEDTVFESEQRFDMLYVKPSYKINELKIFHGFHDKSPVKNSKFDLTTEPFSLVN